MQLHGRALHARSCTWEGLPNPKFHGDERFYTSSYTGESFAQLAGQRGRAFQYQQLNGGQLEHFSYTGENWCYL